MSDEERAELQAMADEFLRELREIVGGMHDAARAMNDAASQMQSAASSHREAAGTMYMAARR